MTFYSEYGEDRWIFDNLRSAMVELPLDGIYLDVGCGHPQFMSNTAWLRDRGWFGLAIDANPKYAEHWKDPKCPFECAVISSRPNELFEFRENVATSRIVAGGPIAQAVMCQRLDTLLRKHNLPRIDFLSLDVEGFEFDAFLTLGDYFGSYWPKIIVAEYNTAPIDPNARPEDGKDFRLLEYLVASNYSAVHRTVANFIYVRR